MPRIEVDITPTMASAPALLMEIAAMIERDAGGLPQQDAIPAQAAVNGASLVPVYWQGGRSFHQNGVCMHHVMSPLTLYIEAATLDSLKAKKSDFLCDYCFKLGKRRATIRARKRREAKITQPPEPLIGAVAQ